MKVQGSAITAESERPSVCPHHLLDAIKTPFEYKYNEGPWNDTCVPPMAHRSETFSFEPLSLQVGMIGSIAYMGSVDPRWVQP